ncbi:hypothetical protein GCM10010448_44390 [Streptomyces glomeratus]|uniref:Uncharacterized protein n=1 Tax=Streptomyces glomeratus TaxID=284452 RepID=A0ABP6LV27_9ACTN
MRLSPTPPHPERLETRTGLHTPHPRRRDFGSDGRPLRDTDPVLDFRLPQLASTNHKYGLVIPRVGWTLRRNEEAPPDNPLPTPGALARTYQRSNFSRRGAQIAAQCQNFLHVGFDRHRRVQQTRRDVAARPAGGISQLSPFELITIAARRRCSPSAWAGASTT